MLWVRGPCRGRLSPGLKGGRCQPGGPGQGTVEWGLGDAARDLGSVGFTGAQRQGCGGWLPTEGSSWRVARPCPSSSVTGIKASMGFYLLGKMWLVSPKVCAAGSETIRVFGMCQAGFCCVRCGPGPQAVRCEGDMAPSASPWLCFAGLLGNPRVQHPTWGGIVDCPDASIQAGFWTRVANHGHQQHLHGRKAISRGQFLPSTPGGVPARAATTEPLPLRWTCPELGLGRAPTAQPSPWGNVPLRCPCPTCPAPLPHPCVTGGFLSLFLLQCHLPGPSPH